MSPDRRYPIYIYQRENRSDERRKTYEEVNEEKIPIRTVGEYSGSDPTGVSMYMNKGKMCVRNILWVSM